MKKYFFAAQALVILASCAVNEMSPSPAGSPEPEVKVWGEEINEDDVMQGEVRVFVSEDFAQELEEMTGEDGEVRISATKAAGTAACSMRRLFPYAGEFEARTRAEGLHRWYVVRYNEGAPATKAAGEFSLLGGVEQIEYVPKIHIVGDPKVTEYVDPALTAVRSASATMPFNDPLLPKMWALHNTGSQPNQTSGCDINVFPVWAQYTTGNKDVIVAVVDGGVDFNHEDLSANMWNNPEKSGDMKYGYNFVTNSYAVTADEHGTHVAGTIAAVNNNGKGVCGIAGGNAGKKIGGVRIMSCQIFQGDDGSADGAQAIKWGADHGAVISQNSWGYTVQMSMPSSDKAAVDYFTKYAGKDASGKQVGPMDGGLVIFAAGNDNSPLSYGRDYSKSLIVTAVGADFRRTYYSNYGEWTDIAAPGGDYKKGNEILSTLPDNKYGLMQGTSMACPHVSGVAALLVSKLGGQGFTPASLRKRLEENVTDISAFTKGTYMGKGLVNAYLAIAGSGGVAPEKPTELTAEAISNNIEISVKVPRDPDDEIPTCIMVYYSKEPITTIDGLEYAMIYTDGCSEGDILTGTIGGLEFKTKYYLVAVARDLAANVSAMSNQVSVVTGANMPPQIIAKNGTSLSIKPHQKGSLDFEIYNPANHNFIVSLEGDVKEGIVLDTLAMTNPKVIVNGPGTASGSYKTRLEVVDEYGDGEALDLEITVLPNNPPKIVKTFDNVLFNSRTAESVSFAASDYFYDEDGEELNYDITVDSGSANFVYKNSKFLLSPMEYGYATITVKASDVRQKEVKQSFRVLVRNSSSEADVYPNPVKDMLNIRTSETAGATVKIVSPLGGILFEDTCEISPFSPLTVDMGNAAPGIYTVSIDINGKSLKYNIVKI